MANDVNEPVRAEHEDRMFEERKTYAEAVKQGSTNDKVNKDDVYFIDNGKVLLYAYIVTGKRKRTVGRVFSIRCHSRAISKTKNAKTR